MWRETSAREMPRERAAVVNEAFFTTSTNVAIVVNRSILLLLPAARPRARLLGIGEHHTTIVFATFSALRPALLGHYFGSRARSVRGARPMFIVDSQVHIWKEETPDRPWIPGARERMKLNGHRTEAFTYEECLELMDGAG